MTPKFSVNLVAHGWTEFLIPTMKSVVAQIFKDFEVNIFDNNSGDVDVAVAYFPHARVIRSPKNIGVWAGHEELFSVSHGMYIVAMTDVVLEPDFLERAVITLDRDPAIGALQAKILQPDKTIIDTTGFQFFKSRKIINRGHGDTDTHQFPTGEIFTVEGAVPIFRKTAIEAIRMNGHVVDPDFRIGPIGYADDLDIVWRMKIFGWKQWYDPSIVAYHNRSTTHDVAKHWLDSFSRRKQRSNIPLIKRKMDWCNTRFAIIKNDSVLSLLKDAPFWLVRELGVFCYTLLFEPRVFAIIPHFFRLLPRMIKKRYDVQRHIPST